MDCDCRKPVNLEKDHGQCLLVLEVAVWWELERICPSQVLNTETQGSCVRQGAEVKTQLCC